MNSIQNIKRIPSLTNSLCKQKAIAFQCDVFSADFAPMFSLGLLNYNEVAQKARWKKCDGIIYLTGIIILYNVPQMKTRAAKQI